MTDLKDVRKPRNKKHAMLALEYMKTYDKIGSYMKVYNCSRENAQSNAYRVFNREDVREMIYAMTINEISDVYDSSKNSGRIIRELEKIAFGNYPTKSKIDALSLLGRATGVLTEGKLTESIERAVIKLGEDFNKKKDTEESLEEYRDKD